MPYIEEKDRARIYISERFEDGDYGSKFVPKVIVDEINAPGEMNYAITEMMVNYLERKGVSYTNMNELVGVLECAKLELYRRMTAPYEDEKCQSNGDVRGYAGENE